MGQKSPLRWVLLWHECTLDYRDGPHWDLMLEREGVADERRLATWSLSELPAGWPGAAADAPSVVDAIALDDHRAAYLDYEGPVSGDRGAVTRVASGEVMWREATEGCVIVDLFNNLQGEVTLVGDSGGPWRLKWRESGS
jgi:hypothetical protein